jgi:RNA polymerase sigma-70 factor (ECF subfamily)
MREPPPRDEGLRLLVIRAQSGDVEAFEALYRRLAPAVFRHLSHVTGDASVAEDVLQDTFVIVFRRLRWLREPSLVRPWVYRIATREAVRRTTARRREGAWQLTDAEWVRVEELSRQPPDRVRLTQQARDAIGQLPVLSRAVLSLHYLESMPLPAVAALLDVPLGTVKSRLAVGLNRVRRLLGVARTSEER